ncbi:MAG TPA: DUF488 domain-containing protein [Sulfuriferula sp.]|nr:DUF488 domain-containing protein [Sulfuriferula sp.]
MIKLKRVYAAPDTQDGTRVLVERLWPRGLEKQHARVDEWLKEIAPSTELRQWFAHDTAKWTEFQSRYKAELAEKSALIAQLNQMARKGVVTLVFAAKDEQHNSAIVLKRYLEQHPA